MQVHNVLEIFLFLGIYCENCNKWGLYVILYFLCCSMFLLDLKWFSLVVLRFCKQTLNCSNINETDTNNTLALNKRNCIPYYSVFLSKWT